MSTFAPRRALPRVEPEASAPADASSQAISERIGALIAIHRRRRRHVQLPLVALAASLVLVGFALFALHLARPGLLPFNFRWAYALLIVGGWLIGLGAMPGDEAYMRALLLSEVVIGTVVSVRQLPLTMRAMRLLYAALVHAEQVAPKELVRMCVSAITWCLSTGVVMLCTIAIPCYLLLASHARILSAFRLNGLAFEQLCVMLSMLGAQYVLFALIETLRDPIEPELIAVFCSLALLAIGLAFVGLRDDRLRSRVHGFLALRGHDVTDAAGIAEMLNGVKASQVLESAASSFRAVTLDELTLDHLRSAPRRRSSVRLSSRRVLHAVVWPFGRLRRSPVAASADSAQHELELEADTASVSTRGSDVAGRRPATEISRPARLGSVDVFVSHSWHDPPAAKWEALHAWGAQFRATHGREPLIWFDRCCIDQANIAAQLPALPVYLAGCNKLLVLLGPSYFSRLWCVVELYIFYQAHLPTPPEDKIVLLPLATPWATTETRSPLRSHRRSSARAARMSELRPSLVAHAPDGAGMGTDERQKARSAALVAAAHFDVRDARAALPSDADRLLAVIESQRDGADAFSPWIRSLVVSKLLGTYH